MGVRNGSSGFRRLVACWVMEPRLAGVQMNSGLNDLGKSEAAVNNETLISEEDRSSGSMEAESNGIEGATEEETMAAPAVMPEESIEEEESEAPEVSEATPATSQAGGRRSQFRIVRETIQALEIELGHYRKSHDASAKKLEAQMASLRKDIATHVRAKDLSTHFKAHQADTKRLEKQMASLRSELVSLKSQMAKEAAKSRAREEAALSKIVAKVKAARPAIKTRAKPSKKKR